MLDYGFSEEQLAIKDLAYEFAVKKIKPLREEFDAKEEFPRSIVEDMRKSELFGLWLPAEYGGSGGGITELVIAMEQLSRVCTGIALPIATSALGGMPILLYGTDEQRKKWLH
ncbi:MAG TPA: acyl-CoA dehydrogenase family protein, partial [bacterium]|nr:acyl-CoA dehydrogenase family protein [bacterium]